MVSSKRAASQRTAAGFMVATLAVGLVASRGVLGLIAGGDPHHAVHPVETVDVVTASRTLYQGVALTPADVYVAKVPVSYLPTVADAQSGDLAPARVFAATEGLVGQVPRERILANEIIRPERLADGGAGIGLNAVIPRGMVAVSLNLRDADAVSWLLEPGTFVDVLSTFEDKLGEPRTETILQAVFVLGVNSRAQGESTEDAAARGRQAPSVTFLVSSRQAEQLALADEVGALSLTMRNLSDSGFVTALEGASMRRLMGLLTPHPAPVVEGPRHLPGGGTLEVRHEGSKTILEILRGRGRETVELPTPPAEDEAAGR